MSNRVGNKTGKVWLVGAGPADAGLMTVKGLEVLQNAEVVVYDKLVGVEPLNRIPAEAKKIDVGKRADNHPVPQEEINRILLREALDGKEVVRLKGGDPFLFGRGGEELELLVKHQIPFEIIPGIPSAISVPAYAGIPVTHRDFCSSVHIITGHQKNGEDLKINFEALGKLDGTLVFLMGVAALNSICSGLLRAGLPPQTPAAIIESGTTARQRKIISTIADLYAEAVRQDIQAPSVIVVGQVCALGELLNWAEKRPLHGVRVLVTRPEKLSSGLSEHIRSLGGEVLELPCIRTVPPADQTLLDSVLSKLRTNNWLVFSSSAGVEAFCARLLSTGKDLRELYGLKIACVGSATAQAFLERGIKADYLPRTYNAQALGAGLRDLIKKGEKVLILRAREASPELPQVLVEAGIEYLDVPVYETVFNHPGDEFSRLLVERYDFDFAAFTSASTVKGFLAAYPRLDHSKIKAVCIGEQTAAEARQHGMEVFLSPQATIAGMVETLINLNK